MPSKYTVQSKEFGRGKAEVKRFSTLRDVQTYVKTQWQGAEYIDGPAAFHSDYCTFYLTGCVLNDLGARGGAYGTDEYWDWIWIEMDLAVLAAQAEWRCAIRRVAFDSERDTFTVYAECRVGGCGREFSFCASGDEGHEDFNMADCGRHREVPVVAESAAGDDSEGVPF